VPLAWEEFETMAVDDWETRKGFLCLTKEEEVALTTLQPIMARHVDEFWGILPAISCPFMKQENSSRTS
jgi:hypothetical protein